MDSKVMVSVILPVYNSVKYIKNTINSILNQNYKNFELIIIDDGANDGTEIICQNYAKQYDKIVYLRQENGGVCKARNHGLKIAKGKYVAFCDHDDEYKKNYLSTLLDPMEEKNFDMIKCSVHYIDVSSDGNIIREYDDDFISDCFTQSQLIKKFVSLKTAYFDVWNGLYKTSIFKENNLWFDEKYIYGMEDYDLNTRIVPYINKIGFLNDCLYTHYMRVGQSTSSKFKVNHIYDIISYQYKSVEILENYEEKLPISWKAALFGKNLIGIVKYCNICKVDKTSTSEFMNLYLKENYKSVKTIRLNLKYIKYLSIAYLAKLKRFSLLYDVWNWKNNIR